LVAKGAGRQKEVDAKVLIHHHQLVEILERQRPQQHAFTMVKSDAVALIPSAMTRTAIAVNRGECTRVPHAVANVRQ
jgi:hypothetical protein